MADFIYSQRVFKWRNDKISLTKKTVSKKKMNFLMLFQFLFVGLTVEASSRFDYLNVVF